MNLQEKQHENQLRVVEDHIGRALAVSAQNGELQSAASYGKPMDYGDGYQETPDEVRMGFKILKDAGVVPPEVELMRDINALRQALDAAPVGEAAVKLQQRLSEMRQQLAIYMEQLRSNTLL